MAAGDLGRRVAVAAVGIPIGIGIIYVGGWILGGVLAFIAVLGAREFYRMAALRGGRPFALLGGGASALVVLLATWRPHIDQLAIGAWAITVALLLVSLGAAVFRRGPDGSPLSSASGTVAGFLYVGGTLAFAPLIHALPAVGGGPGPLGSWAGPLLLIFPITVTWMGDSGAYFSGMRFGRRKLIPSVSPKKTIEGSIGGLVVSALAGSILAWLTLASIPVWGIGPLGGAMVGLVLGAVAQVGDLAESVMKREAGVKDSGTLLPGHGGVLDRFDAVLFNLPVFFGVMVLSALLG
jgi:phosphatidate cytidylyltransferase